MVVLQYRKDREHMKRYIKFICVLLLLLIPIRVNACDSSDLSIQRDLANNINTLVEYRMVNNAPVFDITFTNPGSTRIRDLATDSEQQRINSAVTIRGYSPGQTIRLEVIGYGSCLGIVLLPISINLRPFNPFSNDPICEEAREFNMCNRWEPVKVTHDAFIKQVEEFIERRNEGLALEELKPQDINTWEKTLAFIGNNYISIVVVVIVVVIIIAIVQKIAKKKNQFDFKV